MAVTPEARGRELADLIAALHQTPSTRLVRVDYVEVLSVASPYFTCRFVDGTEATVPHGAIRPIVGYTWRVRQILGGWVGDDAANSNYRP